MNKEYTDNEKAEKEGKAWMRFLTGVTAVLVLITVISVSQSFLSFKNTKLIPNAVDNSTAKGLEDYSVKSNLRKLEQFGKVNHEYGSQELTVQVDGEFDSYITMAYGCEVDYYNRPDDGNKMEVPDDAKVKSIQLTSMANDFDVEAMIEFIKDTMKKITDVEVNDTYIRSLLSDATDSSATCTINDETNDLFDIFYSVEVDPYLGCIVDVKIDVSKNW